jgi:uncharacterized protein YbaA (DUF1428 family)
LSLYVDGFVIPVPKKRLAEYKRFARKYDALWIKHGAIEVHECIADDVKPGKWTSFPQAVKLKANELVVFSWIVYQSRRHRDAVNKKVMADPMMANADPKKMPLDGRRLIWGGFKSFVHMAQKKR